ncbi:MAG: glycoside hydrolase family 3 C-terminal domain-containing protein [Muribaculaceae bacterium]|nr:glycoside hydrolase family 3 C-terminal domain-containing protein [Muribaculaceae bacterium]
MTVGYEEFFFRGFPDKGIPCIYLSDATKGVHLRPELKDTIHIRQLERSTAFPAPIMLAATFNPELSHEYGKAIGEECRAGGVELLLGPGVNLARNSQCGRNYEYLGEDPFVAGRMAAEYIKGLQSTGTAACIKHFIGNETEFYRRRTNSVIDERTLHEIYMRPFKAGIDAGVAFVMTSYNRLNGEWTGESRRVIDTLLRRDLGFKGAVLSDWRSVYDHEKVVKSGQNSIMPGSSEIRDDISALVQRGILSESDIDKMIRPILATCHAFGLYNREKYRPDLLALFPDHERVSMRTAEEGTVLLKNNGLLPLENLDAKKILVTGNYLDKNFNWVNASADVKGYNQITWRQALLAELGSNIVFSAKPDDQEIRNADIVIVSTGTVDREAYERPFSLPAAENDRLRRITSLNPNTIVVVFSGSGVKLTDFADEAAAVIYGWYPGQNGMKAVAGTLTGRVNPSGKLPITIEKDFSDSPAKDVMPEGAKFYTRLVNERMITPYDVIYDEGVLMGYRWYDTKDIEPLFPFGHGLTYTEWEITNPSVKVRNNGIFVKFRLKNTGGRDGAQVVQVYVSEKNPTVVRPQKELKGIKKIFLPSGSSGDFDILLDTEELGFYDSGSNSWKTNPGEYIVYIGTSSRDIIHEVKIKI